MQLASSYKVQASSEEREEAHNQKDTDQLLRETIVATKEAWAQIQALILELVALVSVKEHLVH